MQDIQKIKDYFLTEESLSDTVTKKSRAIHEDDEEKEFHQRMKSFNGLSAKEWASLSMNIWSDVSSPRNDFQKEHGAVYPVKLVERLLLMYSRELDNVFDPFLGIGSTIIGCQNLNRNCIGTELNPEFAQLAQQWLVENSGIFQNTLNLKYLVVNDDCRNLDKYIAKNKISLTITSPPYADFIQKSVEDREKVHKTSLIKHSNNSTVKQYSDNEDDFGNLPYPEFIKQLKVVLSKNYEITKPGGYSCWVVKDHRDTKNKIPYIPFHSDLARAGEEVGWKFHDLIIWDQSKQRKLILLGYPSIFYTNQNCSFIVVFRKS